MRILLLNDEVQLASTNAHSERLVSAI